MGKNFETYIENGRLYVRATRQARIRYAHQQQQRKKGGQMTLDELLAVVKETSEKEMEKLDRIEADITATDKRIREIQEGKR